MSRDNGFLTTGQREYMTGERDLDDHSNKWQLKGRIRKRISGFFDDLRLLEESPYWSDEDFAKVARDSRQANTGLLEPIGNETVSQHAEGVKVQSRIYGDAVRDMATHLEELDIDGSWQDAENAGEQVQEMFIRNIVSIITDVLELRGVTDAEVIMEFFEDVWPEKEKALQITREELSDG